MSEIVHHEKREQNILDIFNDIIFDSENLLTGTAIVISCSLKCANDDIW